MEKDVQNLVDGYILCLKANHPPCDTDNCHPKVLRFGRGSRLLWTRSDHTDAQVQSSQHYRHCYPVD
ncbi:hypothetical protein P3T76_016010 [Phytophthora citrophthora]|uniref:Uncharacterized protein n=1 Tax=Phytophthora citrophthora TaxID=4793 RepID=A0AAD9FYB4_9STRA|nr:hypothetical protein P3T76_016010 [Phytophthora citrophthora]